MNDFKEKFSQIYDQYIEKIYRFVYLKVNSQQIAEDITSGVFLSGWQSYKNQISNIKNQKVKVIENPGAYLYQIARNMVTDYYRNKGRTKVVSIDYTPQIVDNKIHLHEKAIIDSDIEIVKSALQNLKKDYQDVIIWHYLEDMSIAEISEILGKPTGTVRVMIHRGLNAIKDEIRGES